MNVRDVLFRQWKDYPSKHQARSNLFAHIVLVPLFIAGNLAIIVGIARLSLPEVVVGILATVVSLAQQGRAHKMESNQPEPFTGMGNALTRIFLEQWVTFPRFVVSGAWLRQVRAAPRSSNRVPPN